MKRISVPDRQTTKTSGRMQSKIPQYVHGEKKKTKAVPDFGKLHERWQKKLEEGKVCQKKPQTMPTEFNLSKSRKPEASKHAKKQLFSVDDFETNHKSLDAILRGLPQREVASRRSTTATGKDVKRSQSCTNVGRRRVLGELQCNPDQTSKANRRRSRSARAEVPLKALKESDDVGFEPDPQALRSIINSEGMTPVRVAAPKRQTTSGAVIRQFKERPSIYDAMTSSRNVNFAAARLTGKTSTSSHPHKRLESSPGHKRPQPNRDPPSKQQQRIQSVPKSGHDPHPHSRDPPEKSKKIAETQPQSLDDEFEVDPQSLKTIINSEGMTPVRVTAPVRRTLGGPALRQERPSIYDAMTSSRNHSLFGQVRLSEYSRPGPRAGKVWPNTGSSPAPLSCPFGRTPAKGPVPDLIRSATKSEARRVPRNENGILADGPSRRPGEQKHVKWADVFEESAAKEKDNVQKTLFTTNEESEEEGESKENICPLNKPLTPARVRKNNSNQAKSIPQYPGECGQSQAVQSETGQQATSKALWGQTLTSCGDERAKSGVCEFGEGLESGSSSNGESRDPATGGTDGSVYKRGLFPTTTADKANCHDDSPHVSEDVLPISGDRSCIREGVTHSSVVLPQACSRQLAGDSECNCNPGKDTCCLQKGLSSTDLESSKRLQQLSLIVEQGHRNSAQVLQNLPGNLSEDSVGRWENLVRGAEAPQSRDVQATSNAFVEKENKINRDDGILQDRTLEHGNLLAFAPSDGFNVIKENLATSGILLFPTTKDSKDHGTLEATSLKHPPTQCEQPVLFSEQRRKNVRNTELTIRNSESGSRIAPDHHRDEPRAEKRYFGTYNSTDVLRSQAQSQERPCETRRRVINKTTLQENRTMAMFAEGDQDEGSQGPTNSARDPSAGGGGEQARDSVGNFVGRIQKSKKRQSIAELNESISESNLHMQTLCQQAQSLRNQSKTRKNNNIMYQLELIRKQQEELLKLQMELQEQLRMEAEGPEVEGHTDNQWEESGRGTMDTQVSELITSSERMLSLRDEDRLTQNLESIQEEEKNNNDCSYNVKSPMKPLGSKREDLSVNDSLNQTLLSTPRTSQFSLSIQSHPLTPSLQNFICDTQSTIPLIQSPKPVKPALDVQRQWSKSPSPPPIWTAMALKSEAERQTTPDPKATPSVKRRLEHDPDYAISVHEEPMDLSTKSVQESSFNKVPLFETTVTSSKKLLSASSSSSSPKPFHSLEIGSLSLRANTVSSPLITHNAAARPPLSSSRPPFQPTQEIPLYKEVLSIANEQRYREALLDDECARYCCRLQAAQPFSFWFNRGYVNPVATVLSHGDEMHFVPIHEDLLPVVSLGEGSAFYSYSP